MTAGYDLIVVGGGAAGLGAARAAARARASVLLVSDGDPGGDCTFHGCVPSKTLIEAARQGLPYAQAAQRVRDVVAEVAATEQPEVLRRAGIEVRLGRARLRPGGTVLVDGEPIRARAVVLATGSRPAVPPLPGFAGAGCLTNETVFDLPELPASLAVLGGGATGCELAQAFARLGSRVTLIEAAARLLPAEEPAASRTIAGALARDGVAVCTGAAAEQVEDGRIRLAGGEFVTADRVLLAAGRQPATADLDLAAARVATEPDGRIRTDDHLRTTARGVYAAGDVTGRLPYTHAAYEMGRLAAGNALAGPGRRRRRYRPHATPWVTFTDPEVGRVGLTEVQAATQIPGTRVAHLPLSEMDRGRAAGRTDGFVTLLAAPRRGLGNLGGGRIVGATIVAERAGEMIHEPALAMATGMFAGRLAATTHAYPSWSYAVQLAAAQLIMEIDGRRARPAREGGDA